MNKYIIPVCEYNKDKIYNLTILARSLSDCKDKIISRFSEYSESDDYEQFVEDLDENDIIIGDISDVDTL